jgi:hypothetical protein
MKRKKRKNQPSSGFNAVRPAPLYPYDKSTDIISLPPILEEEILHTASTKGTPRAIKESDGGIPCRRKLYQTASCPLKAAMWRLLTARS